MGTRHLPFITPFVSAQVIGLEKKYENGPKKATNLDGSDWEVKGVLGVLENGGIRLRQRTGVVPTPSTRVCYTADPNGRFG